MGLELEQIEMQAQKVGLVREPDLPVMGLELARMSWNTKTVVVVREPDLPVMGLERSVTTTAINPGPGQRTGFARYGIGTRPCSGLEIGRAHV